MSMFIIAVTNGALLSASRHLPTIYPVFSLKCASLPGLRPSSIPPGFNHKSTPLAAAAVSAVSAVSAAPDAAVSAALAAPAPAPAPAPTTAAAAAAPAAAPATAATAARLVCLPCPLVL